MMIRAYRPGDDTGIQRLLSSLGWAHLAAPASWAWEFQRCPGGSAVIQIAEHQGEMVGHYACLPMDMQCGDTVLRGGKIEGSAVDARYRGAMARALFPPGERHPAVFPQLIQRLLAAVEAAGLELCWGFPNTLALKPQLSAGYARLNVPLRIFMVPVNVKRLVARACVSRHTGEKLADVLGRSAAMVSKTLQLFRPPRRHVPNGLRVTEVRRFDDRIDQLWERFAQENLCITIKRDQRYLNWRFVDNPNASYTRWVLEHGDDIVGYLITSVSRGPELTVGHLVDALVLRSHRAAFDLLLARAVQHLRPQVDYVAMWSMRGNRHHVIYERALRREGFCLTKRQPLPVIVWVHPASARKAFLLDPANWYLTMTFTEGAG